MRSVLVLCMVWGLMAQAGSKDGWRSRLVRVKTTAYCTCEICCGKWAAAAKTATGRNARGTQGVAIDPHVFDHGDRFDISGYGDWVLADDTGSAIRGMHIDIRMRSHVAARKYGVRYRQIRVWERVNK